MDALGGGRSGCGYVVGETDELAIFRVLSAATSELMGPEAPPGADKTPPRIVHMGPLTHDGITFPSMKAEEFADGEGYAPNPFGRWECACGWSIEYRMGRAQPSRAMSPEVCDAYKEVRGRALWHADRCRAKAAE